VTDDRDEILRDRDVGLDRGDADVECPPEGGERVLGGEAARAAMAFDVEGACRGCGKGERDSEYRPGQSRKCDFGVRAGSAT
jgi:hypothetical protein